MINPPETVRSILLANVGITGQVGANVWCGLVPPNMVQTMPFKSIAVFVDGLPQSPLVPVLQFRAVLWCMGAEPGFNESWDVARAVHDGLKRGGTEIQAVTGGNVYFYMSDCLCPGREVTDPVTHWPRVVAEYLFTLYETIS